MENIDALEVQTTEIQSMLNTSAEALQQGLSMIKRDGSEWSVRNHDIEYMNNSFVRSFNYVNNANQQTDKCKKVLDRDLLQTVDQENQISNRIKVLNQAQARLRMELSDKVTEVRKKEKERETLRDHLLDLESDLDDKRDEHRNVEAVTSGVSAAAVPMLLLGPFNVPFLVGGVAAASTAGGLLVAMDIIKEKIKSLKKEVKDSESAYDAAQKEYDDLKKEEIDLETDIFGNSMQLREHKITKSKLKQKIGIIAEFSVSVKNFLHKLSLIMNQIKRLKEDTDPEFFYDASALMQSVEELENLAPLKLSF